MHDSPVLCPGLFLIKQYLVIKKFLVPTKNQSSNLAHGILPLRWQDQIKKSQMRGSFISIGAIDRVKTLNRTLSKRREIGHSPRSILDWSISRQMLKFSKISWNNKHVSHVSAKWFFLNIESNIIKQLRCYFSFWLRFASVDIVDTIFLKKW